MINPNHPKQADPLGVAALATLLQFSEETKKMTHGDRAAVAERVIKDMEVIAREERAAQATQN